MDEVAPGTHAPQEFSPLRGAGPARARALRGSAGDLGMGDVTAGDVSAGEEEAGEDPYLLEVRAEGTAAQEELRAQMHLLAALEVAGCTAAPAVLEVLEDGHVRETAPAQRLHGGRRRAETADPPTAERLAVAAAREALDHLLDELHARGWVLGAAPGEGLGVRADGTVLVRDLDGLRRSDSVAERAADRRWVGTVLHDEERTLRRRVDARGGLGDGLLLAPPEGPPVGSPAGVAEAVAPAVASAVPAPPVEETADGTGAAVLRRPPRPADTGRRAAPARRGRRELRGRRGIRRRLAGVRARLEEHRVLVRGGAVAVLLLAMVGLGMRWGSHDTPAEPTPAPVAADAPAEGGAGAGAEEEGLPVLGDPWELGAELAGARHAYVTGLSSEPAAAPGSPALAADDALRAAYAGIQVRGGGPVVHAAEVVEGPTESGRAVLALEISSDPVQLVDPDGALTDLPATDPATVLLHLRWDGGAWRVTEVEQAPRRVADGTGAEGAGADRTGADGTGV